MFEPASYEDIKAGRDLAVVEMNGLSSEPTALYDPSWSYPRAVATLAGCWVHAFALGASHLRRGTRARTCFAAVGRAIRALTRQQQQPRGIAS